MVMLSEIKSTLATAAASTAVAAAAVAANPKSSLWSSLYPSCQTSIADLILNKTHQHHQQQQHQYSNNHHNLNHHSNSTTNVSPTSSVIGPTTSQAVSSCSASSSSVSDPHNISTHLAASSSYLAKMTICGQSSATRENSTNNPSSSLNRSSSSIESIHPFSFGRSHSSSEASSSHNNSPTERICIHNNNIFKCENCNSHPSPRDSDYGPDKIIMNTINPETLLAHETKHLFGSTGGSVAVGIGGNPLAGHLGPIGTSIAGISTGVNPAFSMAGSHLHHTHHHPPPHQTTLHSMTAPGFSIHGHLVTGGQTRRMSNTSGGGGGQPNRVSKSQANNKQFLCPMCNKFFTQKGNLKTHMMIHTGDKPYVCHVCGKSFTQKGNVDTHIKIHTGTKEYSCERCGKSFTQKGNLKTHVRSVHTKEKPYACSVCGKSFSQKGNMHTHIRTHNKDDRFPCGLCGKTFSQKGNLKTHMQRHAGTLPKRYGPGGQRRQTTSRLLQVPAIGQAQSAAAAAAAAAYAIAAAGNVTNIERTHQNPQTSQSSSTAGGTAGPATAGGQQINRNTPVSPNGAEESRSPSSMVHVTAASLNGSNTQRTTTMAQQSVISNVQNPQASREHPVDSPSLYPGSSEAPNSLYTQSHTISHHLQQNSAATNSFNLTTTPSAAAAAAAVLLSSSSSFTKDHKTNHLHFMSSLFH